MTLNRWEFIKKSSHRWMTPQELTTVHSLQQTIPMGERLSVEKQMVPFKARNRLKQSLPANQRNGATRCSSWMALLVYHTTLSSAWPSQCPSNYKLFPNSWFLSIGTGTLLVLLFVAADYQASTWCVRLRWREPDMDLSRWPWLEKLPCMLWSSMITTQSFQ